MAEGDWRKKKGCVRPGSGKVDLLRIVHPAVAFSLVLLTKVFCQKPSCPHCTPGSGMIDTLSHYLMTALVERECWGEILGNTWGLAHKHTHTHTYSYTYSRHKHTLRSSNTLWLGIGCISHPMVCRCVCMLKRQDSPNNEGSKRGADVLQISYILLPRHAILGSGVYGTVHWFLYEMKSIFYSRWYLQVFITPFCTGQRLDCSTGTSLTHTKEWYITYKYKYMKAKG